MSRAARAQRVGRPGRPPLPAHSPRPIRAARRILALLALLGIGAALYVINATFQPFHGAGTGSVAVRIPDGVSASEIGQILERRGVVKSARFFELNATLTLRRADLRAGRYVLARDMSNGDAIDALMQGPKVRVVNTFTVTIPEGRTRRETAPIVRNGGVDGSYLQATASKATLQRVRRLGAPRGTAHRRGLPLPLDLRAARRAPRRRRSSRGSSTRSAQRFRQPRPALRPAQEPEPLRRADHRLDGRARGAAEPRAAADRGGHLQPPEAGDAARHRRHDPLRGEQLDAPAAPERARARHARTTAGCTPGSRRRRSATRGSPR